MSESAGERLKKIRLEKGLSLEDIHKKTKIHLDILKAIEEESLLNINPVYFKGFLKIYCKFLGVDPKDYVADYREPQYTVASVSTKKENKTSKMPLSSSVSLLGFKFFKKINFRKVIRVFLAFVVSLILLRGLFVFGRFVASKRVAVSEKDKGASPLLGKKGQKIKTASGAPANKILSKTVRLGISAKGNCWLQVKVDGKIAFQQVLKKGRFENWEAKQKIELSVGNAGVITLEVNGQPIPPLGRKGQAVKNIIITRDGFDINR